VHRILDSGRAPHSVVRISIPLAAPTGDSPTAGVGMETPSEVSVGAEDFTAAALVGALASDGPIGATTGGRLIGVSDGIPGTALTGTTPTGMRRGPIPTTQTTTTTVMAISRRQAIRMLRMTTILRQAT